MAGTQPPASLPDHRPYSTYGRADLRTATMDLITQLDHEPVKGACLALAEGCDPTPLMGVYMTQLCDGQGLTPG